MRRRGRRRVSACGQGAVAGAQGAGGVDPGGGADGIGDAVERDVFQQQAVHGVQAQMRARGDQFGDGGVGGVVFGCGGHRGSVSECGGVMGDFGVKTVVRRGRRGRVHGDGYLVAVWRLLVGVRGFEPPAPASRTRRSCEY